MTELAKSKKFIAALAAAVLALVGFYLEMDANQIAIITGPLIVYVGAQGLADIGKEKAKVENGG